MTEQPDSPGGADGGGAPAAAALPALPGAGPAAGSRSAWLVLLVAIVASLAADLGSKWLAFERVAGAPVHVSREDVMAISAADARNVGMLVPPHEAVVVVPGVLELTLVLNPGAVFGMGPGQRWFFVGFTAIALGFGVWMFARWTRARDHVAHAAIGMLLGGGLGNLYDRLALGVVRDFLHPLPGLKWPFGLRPLGGNGEVWPYVSNVADALLLIGIVILLGYLYRREREERGRVGKQQA